MTCKSHKKPKKLPYGATKGLYWCRGCDTQLVPEWSAKSIKKRERQKVKKQIKKSYENL